jgi:hypothetical protein
VCFSPDLEGTVRRRLLCLEGTGNDPVTLVTHMVNFLLETPVLHQADLESGWLICGTNFTFNQNMY